MTPTSGMEGDRMLADLAQALSEYQKVWWRRDEHVQERCERVPGLLGRLTGIEAEGRWVTTRDVYHDGNGYVAERRQIHDSLVEAFVPPGDAGEVTPAAYFTTGCPGAGKSTTLRAIVREVRLLQSRVSTAALVDADAVRRSLPEYEQGLGSFVVDPECYDVTYGPVYHAARERRVDVIYDTIGRISSLRSTLEELASEGYSLYFLVGVLPAAAAYERCSRRALTEDGRLVERALIESTVDAGTESLEMLLAYGPRLAGWGIVDTSPEDRPPKALKTDGGCTETLERALERLGGVS